MRRMIVLGFLYTLPVVLFAQGWTAATQPGPNLRNIRFSSVSFGIAVGEDGAIFQTFNGGTSWSFVDARVVSHLEDIFFVDGSIGFIAGVGLYKTTNSGSTWIQLTTGLFASYNGVHFTDISRGVAVGSFGAISRTTDGGSSWTHPTSGTTNSLRAVSFVDPNIGVIVGLSGQILRTVDGGAAWTSVPSGTLQSLRDVSFFGSTVGIAVGDNGTILRSTDGGANWTQQTSNVTRALLGVHMANATTGFVVGNDSTLLKTTDAGVTWNRVPTGLTSNTHLAGTFMIDQNTGVVVGNTGRILRTTNGGASWTNQAVSFNLDLYAIGFADRASSGVQIRAPGRAAMVMQSSGLGSSWITDRSNYRHYRASSGARNAAGDIRIISVGDSGRTQIYWTSGISSSTNYLNAPTTKHLNGVFLVHRDTAYAVGDSGTIFRSNDGTTWGAQTSGTSAHLNDVFFRDVNRGFVVGDMGTLRRTTDGGTTWTGVTSGVTENLNSIYFADTSIGVAVGTGGRIIRTTNGGTTWSATIATANDLHDVHFVNATRGVAVGASGRIIGTNDAGATWTLQQSTTSQTLRGVALLSEAVGIAVGNQNTILRTTGGVTWVQVDDLLPDAFALHQNYPNPFNPRTAIPFDIRSGGFTTLAVYDLLGRQVAVLMNEALQPGSYNVPWDAHGMPSGTYFYRLQTGGFTETKKLLLLK